MTESITVVEWIWTAVGLGLFASGCAGPTPAEVDLTWLSNTTWFMQADGIQVFADAAVSRWEMSPPDFARPESLHPGPVVSDTGFVRRILAALGVEDVPTWIVVGHGHTDHTIDLATIARMTGARIIGSRTACFEAQAGGILAERCRVVEGGEVVELTPRLQVRVIRWAHSGNPNTRLGGFIQAPKELRAPPPVDPLTGGIGPTPWQGYPNGGGARAFLFRYEGSDGSVRWLVSDTGNQFTFDSIRQIGPDYFSDVGLDLSHLDFLDEDGTPREWLAAAVEAAGADTIDLWLGYGNPAHVRQVHDLIHPRVFVPHHWDAYLSDFTQGVTRPFSRPALFSYLDSVRVTLVPPTQYLERYRLTPAGTAIMPNAPAQRAAGLPVRP